MDANSDNHAVLRWGLYALAGLGIASCLFYNVENWRGRQSWKRCRAKLEAQGVVLDWERFIPPAVPDEQNCYAEPHLADWFIRKTNAAGNPGPFILDARPPEEVGPLVLGELALVGEAPSNGPTLRWGEPGLAKELASAIRGALGPCAKGATGSLLLSQPWETGRTVHLRLAAKTNLAASDLAKLLPAVPGTLTNLGPNQAWLELESTNGGFRLLARGPLYDAREHLRLSQRARDALESLRPALNRPLARMPGDYRSPLGRPGDNFVALRAAVQLLADRAQCHLLLGEPEVARQELSMVRQLCHLLEAKPGSDCPTLVQAMIDVAIIGLYADTLHEGLWEHRWGEPQLAALQAELAQVDLLPLLRRGFEAARAYDCWLLENSSREDIQRILSPGGRLTLQGRLSDPTLRWLLMAPHGWTYQSMRTSSELYSELIQNLDAEHGVVRSANYQRYNAQLQALKAGPETYLVALAMPNFLKAAQVCSANQTKANQAYLACALERYRLAHGAYPESLEALRPQWAERLPHDLIGGHALHYVRQSADHFLLYSLGWNGRDDRGAKDQDPSKGDWVWEQ